MPPPAAGEVTIRKFKGKDNTEITQPLPPSVGSAPAPHLDSDETDAGKDLAVTKEEVDSALDDAPTETTAPEDEPEKAMVPVQAGEKVNFLSDDDLSSIDDLSSNSDDDMPSSESSHRSEDSW